MQPEATFLDRVIQTYSKAATDQFYHYDQWPQQVQAAAEVTRLLEARPPGNILDLACGTGAVTTALAVQGFQVTAIDCTPTRIDIARIAAAGRGASVDWLCRDMREIEYDGVFDYVLLRDVIFGIFESVDEDIELLRKIARALKPQGRCLLEVYNKEFALPRGVEGLAFYDDQTDRFQAADPSAGIKSIKLYNHLEWTAMLQQQGLRIVAMDGWKYPTDPVPPPWRADLIVAQKA